MTTQKIRPMAVAGMFYPAKAEELREMIDDLLSNTHPAAFKQNTTPGNTTDNPPKAIIAPHAGYVYSGPVAASAYRIIRKYADLYSRVILLGPSHRVPLLGFATSSAEYFETPLGNIPIDQKSVELINQLPDVKIMDSAHLLEHSLEVHLPFLQMTMKSFSLVPIVAGDASPTDVAILLKKLWGGPETLIVISSDLSHFHDYDTAMQMDFETCKAIEQLEIHKIDSNHACGFVPVRGMLALASEMNMQVHTIDYRNSGDSAGTKDQVVGYGSYVFNTE